MQSQKVTTIKPNTKKSFDITFSDFPPTFYEGGSYIKGYTYKFEVSKDTQNLFIGLSNLNADYDLYLSPSESVDVYPDNVKIKSTYTNSTNYGINDELLFAQLPKGSYYLEIRLNGGAKPLELEQKPSGTLTFNSKIYTDKLATLPNDPLLNEQWYLFNKGYYSFDNRIQNLTTFNKFETDGIIPNADIFAPEAWKKIHSAEDIVVAVIDTGIDIDHPDLKNNIWINKGEIPGNGEDDDGNGKDDDVNGWNVADNNNDVKPKKNWKASSHGTHVAGTIGASGNNGIGVSGVAWDVQLMPIQTEDDLGRLTNSTKAIIYAAKNNADIANMSFGSNLKRNPAEIMLFMKANGTLTEDSPNSIREIFSDDIKAYRHAKKADMLLVIAAGNSGSRNTSLEKWEQIGNNDRSFSPLNFLASFYDHAINVASSDGMNQLSPFTNTGLTTDLAAPGGNQKESPNFGILSTVPFGFKQLTEKGVVEKITSLGYGKSSTWPDKVKDFYNKRLNSFVEATDGSEYRFSNGTSMAAPVVAGAAALIKAANPDLAASEIRQVLLKSATNNQRLKGLAGQNGLQLNLEAAVKFAEQWKGDQSFYTVNEGSNQDDQLNATPNNTWFKASGGDDLLRGNHGDDLLSGGAGDDLLIPGEGLDIIKGGKGQDIIRYFHKDESPIARPDRIKMESDDKIDLSALDGNQSKPGVQKLKLIDSDQFSRKPGELLARSNGVFVDLDGDAFADFGILFSKQLNFDLTADNFIL